MFTDSIDSSPGEPTRALRPFIKSLALWIGACAIAFGALALGMDQLARRLPVDSPAIAALGESVAADGSSPSYPSPTFELASLQGRKMSPQDFLGRVVVIDLWATWCGPCRMQAQFLETLHHEYDGEGVQFLAINSGEGQAAVDAFIAKTPFPYPVLMDPQESVMRRYQATGLPTVMVVDITGKVTFLHVGVVDTATLRREIEKARKGPAQQSTV